MMPQDDPNTLDNEAWLSSIGAVTPESMPQEQPQQPQTPQERPETDIEFLSRSDVPFEPMAPQPQSKETPQRRAKEGAPHLLETEDEAWLREIGAITPEDEKGVEPSDPLTAIGRIVEQGGVNLIEGIKGAPGTLSQIIGAVSPYLGQIDPADVPGLDSEKKAHIDKAWGDFVQAVDPYTIHAGKERVYSSDTARRPEGYIEEAFDIAGEWATQDLLTGGLSKVGTIGAVGAGAVGALIPDEYPWLKAIGMGVGHMGTSLAASAVKGATKVLPKITQEGAEAARFLGLDLPLGAESGGSLAKAAESLGSKLPIIAEPFEKSAAKMSDELIHSLEAKSAIGFGEMSEKAAALSQEAKALAKEELIKAHTGVEKGYKELAEVAKAETLQAKTTKGATKTMLEDASMSPETRAAIEEVTKDSFVSGEEVQKALKEISPTEKPLLSVGESIQGELKAQRAEIKAMAHDAYKEFEFETANKKVNVRSLEKLQKKLSHISEQIGERHLKGEFKSLSDNVNKKAEYIASLLAKKKPLPFKLLTDIEKDLKSFVEYGSEHGASKMVIGAVEETQKIIEDSLAITPDTLALYKKPKELWSDYMKTYVEQDAVNKMVWTQKPEDIRKFINQPSYFKQLVKTLPEDMQKEMRRSLLENIVGKEGLKTGEISAAHLNKLKEFRDVYGKGFPEIEKTLREAASKQHTTPAKLLKTIENIDKKLAGEIGEGTRKKLNTVRTAAIQDLRAASPEAAARVGEIAEGVAGSKKQLQNEVLNAYATGDASKALGSIKTTEDIARLESALGGSAKGKEMGESIKRMKLQEMIGKDVLDVNTGRVSYAKLNTSMNKIMKTEFGKALVGKENMKYYKAIQKYSAVMKEAGTAFANPSGTAPVSATIKAMGMVFAGAAGLASGDLGPLGKVAKTGVALYLGTRFMTNPAIKKMLIKHMNSQVIKNGLKGPLTPATAYRMVKPLAEWELQELAKAKKASQKEKGLRS